MKRCYPCCLLLPALAVVGLITPVTFANSPPIVSNAAVAHLRINRLPNLGGSIAAFITIDGLSVARIGWGQSYYGPLSPGDHFISIMVYPNHMIEPAEKRVSVEAGRKYMFTLKWTGNGLVLE